MSFSEIIGRWPDTAAMAEACNKARGPESRLRDVNPAQIRGWRHRGVIPPKRFPEVAAAAQAWSFHDITEGALNDLYKAAQVSQPEPDIEAAQYG